MKQPRALVWAYQTAADITQVVLGAMTYAEWRAYSRDRWHRADAVAMGLHARWLTAMADAEAMRGRRGVDE